MIYYDLPDSHTRSEIFRKYAKHLKKKAFYSKLGVLSENLSCRDIKDVCKQAERVYASDVIAKWDVVVGKELGGIIIIIFIIIIIIIIYIS